ncbi:MAG: hypothetical protein U0T73_11125 [Chitinophagales bacterium]
MELFKTLFPGLILLISMNVCASKGDSLWCASLHEMVKAASLDIVTVEVLPVNDSGDVKPFKPRFHLSNIEADTVEKKYGKVTYRGVMYPSTNSADRAELYWRDLKSRCSRCLDVWTEQQLPASNEVIHDCWWVNTEDETVVRLQLVQRGGLFRLLLQVY